MKAFTLIASALLITTTSYTQTSRDSLEYFVTLLSKTGSCYAPNFSPDGKEIAFLSNMSGSPQVWKVSADGGWPQQLSAFTDPVTGLSWSPDGKYLAFPLAPGGGLNEQVFLMRPDGSGTKMISEGGKINYRFGPWSRDGKTLVLSSNKRDPASIDNYFYYPADGRLKLASQNQASGSVSDIAPDGRMIILNKLANRGNNNLFYKNVDTGNEVLLTPHEGPGTFFGEFSPDGKTIYLASNNQSDLLVFSRISLAEAKVGKIETLASRKTDELENFVISEDCSTAVLIWNASGKNEIDFLDLKTLKLTKGPLLPAELLGALSFSKAGDKLVMVCSGSAKPQDIWIYELRTGAFRQITQSPHAGIDLSKLVTPELVKFPTHDGLELSGWLYTPKNTSGSLPMVLSYHGGPEGQERPGFSITYQSLLASGIAVFAPNVRGSSGFGKRFVNLDNGALRANGVKDIESCVSFVIKNKGADPKKIGIMGGSYGGYMVMAGLTEYPDLFAAGANLYGVVNFKTFFEKTEPWMAAISKVEYGDPDTQADMLAKLSPINKVANVKAPTIVLHGANDTNVPVVEAEQVVNSLKSRNIPVEYILFPDEGHGWRKIPNRIRSNVAVVNWFDKYLK